MITLRNRSAGWALVLLLLASFIDVSAALGGSPAPKNLLAATAPINSDGTLNVVISVPAGTIAKGKAAGKAGKAEAVIPAHLQSIPLPANYGLIPHTSQPKGQGDEGAALPAIVLGSPIAAGTVAKARALGALVLTEGVRIYDIALLVAEGGSFPILNSIEEFDAKFPGVTAILKAWFTAQKGAGKDGKPLLDSHGFYDREDAIQIIGRAILSYEKARVADADKRPLDKNGNPILYSSKLAKNEYRE